MNKNQLAEKVFTALGTASMCWSETPKGTFDSTLALKIGNKVVDEIYPHLLKDDNESDSAELRSEIDYVPPRPRSGKEVFDDIVAWQKQTFPHSTPSSKIAHLEEEVIELMNDVFNNDMKGARAELADCIILLFGTASVMGMSYEDVIGAIEAKMAINKNRVWGVPDQNGVVNHVKTTPTDDTSNG